MARIIAHLLCLFLSKEYSGSDFKQSSTFQRQTISYVPNLVFRILCASLTYKERVIRIHSLGVLAFRYEMGRGNAVVRVIRLTIQSVYSVTMLWWLKAYKSSGFRTVKDCNEPYSWVASGEAKTKPGSEATKTLSSVSKRSPSHEEKSTKGPVYQTKAWRDASRNQNDWEGVTWLPSYIERMYEVTINNYQDLKYSQSLINVIFPIWRISSGSPTGSYLSSKASFIGVWISCRFQLHLGGKSGSTCEWVFQKTSFSQTGWRRGGPSEQIRLHWDRFPSLPLFHFWRFCCSRQYSCCQRRQNWSDRYWILRHFFLE